MRIPTLGAMCRQNICSSKSGPKKPWQPQTWQDSTRFSPLDFSLLSPDFRGLVLLNYTENLEKKQKIQWRASSGDGAPKLQISVPCRGRTCPEQEAPKIGTPKCLTKRGVREPLNVKSALNNRELVKAEVFERRVFEQDPIKGRKRRGHFPWTTVCVGTVRGPPKMVSQEVTWGKFWGILRELIGERGGGGAKRTEVRGVGNRFPWGVSLWGFPPPPPLSFPPLTFPGIISSRCGAAKGSSISWVVKLKGDKTQNACCQMGGQEIKLRLSARIWVVAKLQGDQSAPQSSIELYDPRISAPFRFSWIANR